MSIEKQVPFCTNCNTDKHIIERSGGGYRCTECSRIWDDREMIIGEMDTEEGRLSVQNVMKLMNKAHISSKKNKWLCG